MRDQSRPPLRSSGFILLHTLWLLLTASALVSGVLILANRASENYALAEQSTHQSLALESAIEAVIHDLVVRGAHSHWTESPSTSGTIEVHGERVVVRVQNVAGLVDAGTADIDVLGTLLNKAWNGDTREALGRIDSEKRRTARPFSSYAEFQALSGLSDRATACLFPYLTLFSGQSAPTPLLAPPNLAAWLGMVRSASTPTSAMETPTTTAGSTYRVEADPIATHRYAGQRLSVEVVITGQIRPSHLVRSWLFLPRDSGKTPCEENTSVSASKTLP